jgi:anti-sigma B factor antagonist
VVVAEFESSDLSAPGHLTIRRTADAQGVVLALHGELDLGSAPALAQALAEIENSSLRGLVIDLSGLEFMDSTGLALIVGAHRDARESGRRLRFRRGSRQVQRLLEMTGIIDQLSFEEP